MVIVQISAVFEVRSAAGQVLKRFGSREAAQAFIDKPPNPPERATSTA